MKKYFQSVIDDSFLMEFYDQKPKDIEIDNSSVDVWRNFLNFLRHKTAIDLDISPKTLEKYNEYDTSFTFLKHFIDISFNGEGDSVRLNSQVLQKTHPKQFIDEGSTAKFIFYNSLDQTFIGQDNKTGYYNFSGEEILNKWESVYSRPKLASIIEDGVRIGDFKNWQDFQIYNHPLNSIIIIDNYICSHLYNLQNNLFPLLKILLPKKDLYSTIDVMIITSEFYKYADTGKTIGINSICKKISRFISEELGLKNCRLSIIQSEVDKYHDRHIFTNYFVIKSGYPFSVCDMNNRVRIDTPIDFYSDSLVMNNNDNQSNAEYYNVFLHYIRTEIVSKSKIHTECMENRLLKNLPK